MLDGTVLYERFMRALAEIQGARARRVHYPGGCVHALDVEGEGTLPDVVLLHGFSASGPTQYLPMLRRLRPHVRRILLPDLPGHGSSRVPARLDDVSLQVGLEAALQTLLRRPAVVFASSLAGGLALRYASRHPGKVAGLMVCSPGGAPLDAPQLGELTRLFTIDSHRDALGFVDRLFRKPHPLRHALAYGVRRQFARPHLRGLLEHAKDAQFLAPSELQRLSMPVHLIWGRADRILPESHLGYFRRHLPPHAEVETPPGYGHAPFLDRAPDLAERLLQFTRRVAAASGRPATGASTPSDNPY
ncbi:MAG: alpha/beta fold hydrolase [Polyangiaceae bacterium]